MNKNYLFYVLLTIASLGFSQTTIVTVDRPNIIGPTNTDNVANISSSGFTRGSGVALSTTSTNFTANGWTIGGDQATAATNNDFIEWSITASTTFEITLEELDIRLRRSNTGPTDWEIYYSLDNFATPGTALSAGAQAIPTANVNTDFNLPGLSVLSGASGTITFRLYAWGATNATGILRVIQNNTWNISAAVPSPGLRLIGTVATTSTNSIESDIIASTFPLDPVQQNIDYTAFNATSGLNLGNAVPLGAFTIRDGGAAGTDTDTDGTTLTSIEFEVTNSDNIAALAILDLGTFSFVSEVTSVSNFTTFSGLNLLANDNTTRQFVVYATFNSTVTDNEQVQLMVHSVTTLATGSSLFALANAGAAATSIAGDDNRIEVTASQFQFNQQPTDGNQGELMVPFPTIGAVDSNLNLDLDANFAGIDVATISGSSSIVGETYVMTNGEAILDKVVFNGEEINRNLIATSTSPSLSGTSTAFNINGPLIAIAQQNFDSETGWTYTTSVAPFGAVSDWGDTVGYFGEIALADAAPINNPLFDTDIFGENDLNDVGNPFAVLTFSDVDVTAFSNIKIKFDWQVVGYNNNANDVEYRLVLNGSAVGNPWVTVFDGNGSINDDQGRVTISIPDGNTTVGLELRLRNNRAAGYSGFDNFKVVSEFDGLIFSNSGWSPNAPSAATGGDDAYILDGTYIVPENIEVSNLFINSAATTTIPAGQSITTNSGVVNNGTLELNSVSTSYASLITDNMLGKVIYNRHVNQFSGTGSSTGNNDLISAPVTDASQTFLALRTANTDIPSGNIGGVPSFLFGPFNNVTNSYVNYTAADNASLVEAGIGYRTASVQPTGSTFEFVGDVETGTLAVPITVGAASRSNLIGNPYPSYISLATFLAENSTEFDPASSGVYGYIGNVTSGFLVWNQAYSDANPTAKLTPGQGFFVNSKDGGGSIDFTPAMRTTGTTDDFISGRAANQNLAHLNLKITKDAQQYQTALYFNDNASLSMDAGYDSELFEDIAPDFAIYSHLVEDNLGNNLAVQAVSFADLDNVTIPLGINVAQGEQTIVSISEHNIPDGVSVTLEDNVTNTFTDLLVGDYTFTPSTTLSNTGRFYIHFSRSVLGDTDAILNGIEIYTDVRAKAIVIKGQLDNQTQCNLYDIQGRVISAQNLEANTTEHRIDASHLTSGVYVIELHSLNGTTRTEKLILR